MTKSNCTRQYREHGLQCHRQKPILITPFRQNSSKNNKNDVNSTVVVIHYLTNNSYVYCHSTTGFSDHRQNQDRMCAEIWLTHCGVEILFDVLNELCRSSSQHIGYWATKTWYVAPTKINLLSLPGWASWCLWHSAQALRIHPCDRACWSVCVCSGPALPGEPLCLPLPSKTSTTEQRMVSSWIKLHEGIPAKSCFLIVNH